MKGLKFVIKTDGESLEYATDLGGILDYIFGHARANTEVVTEDGEIMSHGEFVTSVADAKEVTCTFEFEGNTDIYEFMKECIAYHEGSGYGCINEVRR